MIDDEYKYILDDYSIELEWWWYINCVKCVKWIVTKIRIQHLILWKPEKWMCVDHKNWNKFDNRKCNIHIVSYSYNNTNHKKRKDSKQIYKWIQLLPSWKYSVKTTGWKRLWTYETDELAYKAYNEYIYSKFNLTLTNI